MEESEHSVSSGSFTGEGQVKYQLSILFLFWQW